MGIMVNYGIFLIMGNAGFISSTVEVASREPKRFRVQGLGLCTPYNSCALICPRV